MFGNDSHALHPPPEWNTLFALDRFPAHAGQQIIVDLYDENKNVKFQMQPEVKELDKYRLEWRANSI